MVSVKLRNKVHAKPWCFCHAQKTASAKQAKHNLSKSTFLQQTRDAMNRLCDEKGYPDNQGRENMICALALAGMGKNMPGVDAAYVKDNNVSIVHDPKSPFFKMTTMDSTVAANTPAQQSLEELAGLAPTKQQEQDLQSLQQQQVERQGASIRMH